MSTLTIERIAGALGAEVRGIEERSGKALGEKVKLTVWARAELQVTDDSFAPLGGRRSGAAPADSGEANGEAP